jgi:hypothetical protein
MVVPLRKADCFLGFKFTPTSENTTPPSTTLFSLTAKYQFLRSENCLATSANFRKDLKSK